MTPAEITEYYPQAPNAVAHLEKWPDIAWEMARREGPERALAQFRAILKALVQVGDQQGGRCSKAEAKAILPELDTDDLKCYLRAKMGML